MQTVTEAPVIVGADRATLEDLIQVARLRRPVQVDPEALARMDPSREWLDSVVEQMEAGEPTAPIYSINTGFGSLAGRRAFDQASDAAELSRRLVLSNAAGVGRYVDEEVVRATMFIRIVSLTQGCSGRPPRDRRHPGRDAQPRRVPGHPRVRLAGRLRGPDSAGARGRS